MTTFTETIVLENARESPYVQAYVFMALVVMTLLGFQLFPLVVPFLFGSANKIPIKGKHLDELSSTDNLYIGINKGLTLVFLYHLHYAIFNFSWIKWELSEITFSNTVLALVGYYIVYDFFYMNFHRLLHLRALYPYIHKHHHRQKAPSRGYFDAINVHPFEYVVGEYIHLVAIYFIPAHLIIVIMFVLLGGIFASLNHTRFDVNIPYIFSSKIHDVHHRLPESNYSQFTMLWDTVFGTYRSYEHNMGVVNMKED
jgi:sterol desaturase/sphingolipid hydroxylase (fatty acid hydroxylase superfamily)